MKIALLSSLAAVLAACGPAAPRMALDHATPLLLAVRVEQRVELELVSHEVRDDGVLRALADDPTGLKLESSDSLEFVDERLALSNGRVATLVRTYARLEGAKHQSRLTLHGGVDVDDRIKSSPFAGASVRFERRGEELERSLVKQTASSGAERELALDGLEPDCDFAALLPAAPVEPSQRWRVHARELAPLLYPGGDLELAAAEDDQSARHSAAQLRRNLEGEIEVIFWGVRELSGARLGVFQLRGTARSHALTALPGARSSSEQRHELVRELDGELLWQLDEGRAHAARLDARWNWTVVRVDAGDEGAAPRVVERRSLFTGQSLTRIEFAPLP